MYGTFLSLKFATPNLIDIGVWQNLIFRGAINNTIFFNNKYKRFSFRWCVWKAGESKS